MPRLILAADAEQTTTFAVGQTALPAGEGETIIKTFAPALAGQGFGSNIEADLNPQIGTLARSLEATIQKQLDALNFVPFVKKMADAGGMVARSMPVDYATKFNLVSLTGAARASGSTTLISQASRLQQDFNNTVNGQSPDVAASADASVMLGINLAAFHLSRRAYFDPDRMQLFVSALRLPIGNIATDSYGVDVWHLGVHGKYLLFGPKQLADHFDFARFGGLALTTGFVFASQDIAIRANLPADSVSSHYTLPRTGQTLTLNYNYAGSGIVSTHSDLYSVPIEVSTSLQLLYFLTLYAGGAVDFTWGSTAMRINAAEPVDVSLTDETTTLSVLKSDPTLAINVQKQPSSIAARAFFGLQINAGVAGLFVQGSIDSTKTVGAVAGLRFFY